MEYIGRMAEIMLCILCLTLIPAGSALQSRQEQEQNHLTVQAEMFCGKIRRKGILVNEEYERFCRAVERQYPGYDFEIMVARKYVMPLQNTGGETIGLPVKIWYRKDIEKMLAEEGAIVLEGMVFVNVSIYGEENFFYTCGGEVW